MEGKKMKNRLEKDQTGIHIEEKKKEQWENGQSSSQIQEHKQILFAIIEFKQTPIGQNRIETSGLSGEETTTGLPLSDISLMLR